MKSTAHRSRRKARRGGSVANWPFAFRPQHTRRRVEFHDSARMRSAAGDRVELEATEYQARREAARRSVVANLSRGVFTPAVRGMIVRDRAVVLSAGLTCSQPMLLCSRVGVAVLVVDAGRVDVRSDPQQ